MEETAQRNEFLKFYFIKRWIIKDMHFILSLYCSDIPQFRTLHKPQCKSMWRSCIRFSTYFNKEGKFTFYVCNWYEWEALASLAYQCTNWGFLETIPGLKGQNWWDGGESRWRVWGGAGTWQYARSQSLNSVPILPIGADTTYLEERETFLQHQIFAGFLQAYH